MKTEASQKGAVVQNSWEVDEGKPWGLEGTGHIVDSGQVKALRIWWLTQTHTAHERQKWRWRPCLSKPSPGQSRPLEAALLSPSFSSLQSQTWCGMPCGSGGGLLPAPSLPTRERAPSWPQCPVVSLGGARPTSRFWSPASFECPFVENPLPSEMPLWDRQETIWIERSCSPYITCWVK